MNKAKEKTNIFYFSKDEKFLLKNRQFQGITSLAVTENGRLFAGWCSGGDEENHTENYVNLIYSDDFGDTWSDPILVIQSSAELLIHALDIQMYRDKDNRMHVCWCQNNIEKTDEFNPYEYEGLPVIHKLGFLFNDFIHQTWETIIENPDGEITFSKPKFKHYGFFRNKPTKLSNGRIIFPAYSQLEKGYTFLISDDNEKSFKKVITPDKPYTDCDEAMVYERDDHSLVVLGRTVGPQHLGRAFSYDNGDTWTHSEITDIENPITRFYVEKLPSGRVLLVNNEHKTDRTNMTISLSEDDGKTWKYKKLIDTRPWTSYPDVDFYDGKFYMIYDRERFPYYGPEGKNGACEIILSIFTEEDIINPDSKIIQKTISKIN